MFLGWYWMGRSSIRGPWLETVQENPLQESVRDHFERLWDHAQKVDLQNIEASLNEIEGKEGGIDWRSVIDDPEGQHYCGYYCRDGKVENFILSLSQHTRRVALSQTRSREDYYGSFKTVGKDLVLDLRTVNQGSERPVYIILDVGGSLSNFQNREVALGTMNYIRETGTPVATKLLIQKIEAIPPERQPVQPATLPEEIRLFLTDSELIVKDASEVHDLEHLREHLAHTIEQDRKLRAFLAERSALYRYYFLHRKDQRLAYSHFRLDADGRVEVWWEKECKFKGKVVRLMDNALEMRAENSRGDFFYVLLREGQPRRDRVLWGVFLGRSAGRTYAGRIFSLPLEGAGPQPPLPASQHLDWDSPEVDRILEKNPRMLDFFLGKRGHIYLDDLAKVPVDPQRLDLPPGGPLDNCAGTFSYYYLSARRPPFHVRHATTPKLRRLILHISPHGRVRLKGLGGLGMEGYATRLGEHRLCLFLYRHGRKELFEGFAHFYVGPGYIEQMTGVATLSAGTRPLGRQVVCVREQETFAQLVPEEFAIGSPAFVALNERLPGLATYLASPLGNFIQTPDVYNQESFVVEEPHADAYFRSACYLATQGEGKEAIRELHKALMLGFQDVAALRQAMAVKGVFVAHKAEVMRLLTSFPHLHGQFPDQDEGSS